MNSNIVNVLSWSKPPKTAMVLLGINAVLWVLMRQRPFYVLPMGLLIWYCRNLWRHRIRREVLIDPPDHEDWMNLSTYDMQQATSKYLMDLFHQWMAFRQSNHLMWTLGTCTGWIMLAKVGLEMDFLTLLFVLSNAAFLIYPAFEIFPKIDFPEAPKEEEIEPPVTRSKAARTAQVVEGPAPILIGQPSSPPQSPIYDFYEGIVTRSISAAAISMSLMSSPAGAVFNIGGTLSSQETLSCSVLETGAESLSPPIAQMPDIEEVVDSDPEDDFLFDAKHFDKSSSSTSVSTSFEIIDDDL